MIAYSTPVVSLSIIVFTNIHMTVLVLHVHTWKSVNTLYETMNTDNTDPSQIFLTLVLRASP